MVSLVARGLHHVADACASCHIGAGVGVLVACSQQQGISRRHPLNGRGPKVVSSSAMLQAATVCTAAGRACMYFGVGRTGKGRLLNLRGIIGSSLARYPLAVASIANRDVDSAAASSAVSVQCGRLLACIALRGTARVSCLTCAPQKGDGQGRTRGQPRSCAQESCAHRHAPAPQAMLSRCHCCAW